MDEEGISIEVRDICETAGVDTEMISTDGAKAKKQNQRRGEHVTVKNGNGVLRDSVGRPQECQVHISDGAKIYCARANTGAVIYYGGRSALSIISRTSVDRPLRATQMRPYFISTCMCYWILKMWAIRWIRDFYFGGEARSVCMAYMQPLIRPVKREVRT